jgi:hypothetical protein
VAGKRRVRGFDGCVQADGNGAFGGGGGEGGGGVIINPSLALVSSHVLCHTGLSYPPSLHQHSGVVDRGRVDRTTARCNRCYAHHLSSSHLPPSPACHIFTLRLYGRATVRYRSLWHRMWTRCVLLKSSQRCSRVTLYDTRRSHALIWGICTSSGMLLSPTQEMFRASS